jgi:hypothetical protein
MKMPELAIRVGQLAPAHPFCRSDRRQILACSRSSERVDQRRRSPDRRRARPQCVARATRALGCARASSREQTMGRCMERWPDGPVRVGAPANSPGDDRYIAATFQRWRETRGGLEGQRYARDHGYLSAFVDMHLTVYALQAPWRRRSGRQLVMHRW